MIGSALHGNRKKGKRLLSFVVLMCLALLIVPIIIEAGEPDALLEEELLILVSNIFQIRNIAMKDGNLPAIKELYNTNLRNGLWAYIHEEKKVAYLKNWSLKQGITFTDITTNSIVKWWKGNETSATVNLLASTTYRYVYMDQPDVENVMRIGAYHELKLTRSENEVWLIAREWYTDPFADSLDLTEQEKTDENKTLILATGPRDFSGLDQRRADAVTYADQYSGAAGTAKDGYQYNKDYKNYNSLGGDCANFVSQILYEGAKFRKTSIWSYDKDGSRAWLKAQGLKDFLLNSGRGSLIAYGSYNKVLKASYELLPGDVIAYEKKGEVTHVSLVSGADSRGYTLVNCHNTDRYRVPWDLGWSNEGIRYYLIRVHY